MANEEKPSNLPADIAAAVTSVVHALIPSSLKALNRLVGAGVEIPVAYLDRVAQRAKAKTSSYVAVEEAVADAVALGVAADKDIARRAMANLVAKEYRKQENREAIAREFLSELQSDQAQPDASLEAPTELDDDWLNVFERYAEDASTERLQKLWGRVLAGEVRKPGRFTTRTLRFLSEFSQADALLFADFCSCAFGGIAPKTLASPDDQKDISGLLNLETAGLITGASGPLKRTLHFNSGGFAYLVEHGLTVQFCGTQGASIPIPGYLLTPLGEELISLLPGRDPREAARKVAQTIRNEGIMAAYVAHLDAEDQVHPFEVLWQPPADLDMGA